MKEHILSKLLTNENLDRLCPELVDIFGYEGAKLIVQRGYGLTLIHVPPTRKKIDRWFIELYVKELHKEGLNYLHIAQDLRCDIRFVMKILKNESNMN